MNGPPPPPKEDGESSFSMLIASGPFTQDADLRYRPWQNLAQVISKESPDAVLLVSTSLYESTQSADLTLARTICGFIASTDKKRGRG
jgi:hypothetical protein